MGNNSRPARGLVLNIDKTQIALDEWYLEDSYSHNLSQTKNCSPK